MKKLLLLKFRDEAILFSTQDRACLPFAIKRAYLIMDVKRGSIRGMHAHKKARQALFCIQGSVVVSLDDGKKKRTVRLSDPQQGAFIDRMVWVEMTEFSKDAVLLVFASEYFDQSDYVRDRRMFRKLAHEKHHAHE